ncbi:LysR family transcriptional regulator [Vibrio fluvialis]|uniref:LysR family transcriptional regulator n=1 Tax=Vibrio fluvialis TaxID=676 RepID=UPI001F1998AD|nr:LysR family transcriptional regulator [Vibrio fluvialis]MCE7659245.1 LysR family transcriptional regulator [Vibrio fluvialis]
MNSIFGNIDDLYLFFCVVEEGSLVSASKKLKLPISTMSRRLSALESRLNLRLLEKQGRELVATQSGLQAFLAIRSGMENLESTFNQMLSENQEVTGSVKLAIPHHFYRAFVGKVVEEFIRQHPKVHVELALSQESVTPETNRDLLITFDIDNMEGMIARPLFKANHGFFVSPEYLAQCGPITSLDQLEALDWISVDRAQEIPIYCGEEFERLIHIRPKLIVNDINAIASAVERGLGVASLPYRHVSKSMNIVQLLPKYHRSAKQAYLVYRDRKYQPRALTLLVEALLDAVSKLDKGAPVVKGD